MKSTDGNTGEIKYYPPGSLISYVDNAHRPLGNVIFNTVNLKVMGGYDEALKWHCDVISLLIGNRHGAVHVAETLLPWRLEGESYFTRGVRNAKEQRGVIEILLCYFPPEYYNSLWFIPHFLEYRLRHAYLKGMNFRFIRQSLISSIFWRLPFTLQCVIRSFLQRSTWKLEY